MHNYVNEFVIPYMHAYQQNSLCQDNLMDVIVLTRIYNKHLVPKQFVKDSMLEEVPVESGKIITFEIRTLGNL